MIEKLRQFGKPPRIMGLDIARGLAIIGMAGAHLGAVDAIVWSEPATWGGIIHGRSAILFAVLAGVSIAIVSGRSVIPEAHDLPRLRLRLLGRSMAIFMIGLVLEILNTGIAVILGTYALLFLIATLFLRLTVKQLFISAGLVALLGPIITTAINVFALSPYGLIASFTISSIYPIFAWVAFLLLGMGIGRLNLASFKTVGVVLLLGLALAVSGNAIGAQIASAEELYRGEEVSKSSSQWISEIVTMPGEKFDATGLTCDVEAGDWATCYTEKDFFGGSYMGQDAKYFERLLESGMLEHFVPTAFSGGEHSGGVMEIVGSGGIAMVIIALSILLSLPLRFLLIPIAAIGSMPLTAYALHIFILFVLNGGPGGFSEHDNFTWLYAMLGIGAFALLWALFIGKGPLEKLTAQSAEKFSRGVGDDNVPAVSRASDEPGTP